jgi:hypothetical protein
VTLNGLVNILGLVASALTLKDLVNILGLVASALTLNGVVSTSSVWCLQL